MRLQREILRFQQITCLKDGAEKFMAMTLRKSGIVLDRALYVYIFLNFWKQLDKNVNYTLATPRTTQVTSAITTKQSRPIFHDTIGDDIVSGGWNGFGDINEHHRPRKNKNTWN